MAAENNEQGDSNDGQHSGSSGDLAVGWWNDVPFPAAAPRAQTALAEGQAACLRQGRKENEMGIAVQAAIWLGAGITLVMLLSRRRKRREVK